ncbi:TetR/AcrR family transcriptional regulator [Calidifontibacter indicus]|uniref:TetR/AcrR family transcriptional regulator n=1 Tax=Calidifontibacter indicus TaxID=419650 RepID=UPI001B87CDA3|nr:TetR/AcrR family transcriptional regulator [Calidifontibacter indicus]
MTGTAGRHRRLEADARREEILGCAVRLFGERPYSQVSTIELADAAGVTRGLIHHYFGTKRDLYLEVVRAMVLVPNIDDADVPQDRPVRERVEHSVDWFLDTVARHGRTYIAVTGPEGIAGDSEVERILATADDIAARKILQMVGLGTDSTEHSPERAALRAYCLMAKGAVREWLRSDTLTRAQAHLLLTESLIAIVGDVLPAVTGDHSGTEGHTVQP